MKFWMILSIANTIRVFKISSIDMTSNKEQCAIAASTSGHFIPADSAFSFKPLNVGKGSSKGSNTGSIAIKEEFTRRNSQIQIIKTLPNNFLLNSNSHKQNSFPISRIEWRYRYHCFKKTYSFWPISLMMKYSVWTLNMPNKLRHSLKESMKWVKNMAI